jgi:hypothetical protein
MLKDVRFKLAKVLNILIVFVLQSTHHCVVRMLYSTRHPSQCCMQSRVVTATHLNTGDNNPVNDNQLRNTSLRRRYVQTFCRHSRLAWLTDWGFRTSEMSALVQCVIMDLQWNQCVAFHHKALHAWYRARHTLRFGSTMR